MNTLMIIVGLSLVVFGALRLRYAQDTPTEPEPEHGDRRITQYPEGYFIEQYIKWPGWHTRTAYKTLEEAQADKARWDQIRNPTPLIHVAE